MCCKSYLICFSLFFAVLLSPVLGQAQTANQTKAESPSVKVEKVALNTQIAEVETSATPSTAAQSCMKTATCPPCPSTCPPNGPQCKPKACSKSKASAAQANPQPRVIKM